mgnify:CR=1 FL=1
MLFSLYLILGVACIAGFYLHAKWLLVWLAAPLRQMIVDVGGPAENARDRRATQEFDGRISESIRRLTAHSTAAERISQLIWLPVGVLFWPLWVLGLVGIRYLLPYILQRKMNRVMKGGCSVVIEVPARGHEDDRAG